jgi:RNA polymerase sigma-70 factor, ECF subfamily
VASERVDQNEPERVLHGRLLDGDPLATTDLYFHFAERILRGLKAKYQTTDPDLVEEAVLQTLLDYFLRPERYDPAKRSLRGYLFMSAERDLINLRQQDERQRALFQPADPVELDDRARKEWEEGGGFAEALADDEAAAERWDEAMAIAQTEEEKIVQRLRLAGERSTAAYATALGWTELPLAEQRKRLYLIKDRLDQRSRRRGERHG